MAYLKILHKNNADHEKRKSSQEILQKHIIEQGHGNEIQRLQGTTTTSQSKGMTMKYKDYKAQQPNHRARAQQ